MRTKKFLFYLLAVLLGGCVPVMSLHRLFTEEKLVFEEKLLGIWADDPNDPETTWEFKRFEKQEKKYEKAYELIFSDDDGRKGIFTAHLVKLQNRLFLDVFPEGFPSGQEDAEQMKLPYNTLFFVPVHTFIKVDAIGPHLIMRLTNGDNMEKLLEEDPNAVKHAFIEDAPLLTAPTKELQAFVLKYADDERVFTGENILSRKKSKLPQEPCEQDPNEGPKEK